MEAFRSIPRDSFLNPVGFILSTLYRWANRRDRIGILIFDLRVRAVASLHWPVLCTAMDSDGPTGPMYVLLYVIVVHPSHTPDGWTAAGGHGEFKSVARGQVLWKCRSAAPAGTVREI